MKVKIRVGQIEIDYEGPEGFLMKSLPVLIQKLRDSLPEPLETEVPQKNRNAGSGTTLAAFLKSKSVGDNQTRRFLATAVWLHARGAKRLSTADVRQALKDNHQNKIGNPAQSLNTNVGSGHCEKDGKQFFVTDGGRGILG